MENNARTFHDSQIMAIQDLADAYVTEKNLEAELAQARKVREEAERTVTRRAILRLNEPITVAIAGETGTLVTVTKTESNYGRNDTHEFVVSKLAEVL